NKTQIVIAGFDVVIAAFYIFNSKKPEGCLDPEKFRDFKLVKCTQLTHNVAKFKFALPTPTSVFVLPIGQHISCREARFFFTDGFACFVLHPLGVRIVKAKRFIKPYTPTTVDTDLGYFELVIKMYPQGRMSHHFREMKEGDYLSVKGLKVGLW
ncbi:NADH-cytochrome b5 reductase 1, partial [Tanacetum coccineum]